MHDINYTIFPPSKLTRHAKLKDAAVTQASMSVTFTPSTANAWIFNVPAAEFDIQLNAMLFLAHKAMQQAAPAPVFGTEHAQAFQRVYDMLSAAVPQIVQTQHSSRAKGASAEKSMDDLISDSFPSWQLRDMSHVPHCGDRMLSLDERRILIEFKDYARAVPTKEVEKFERDLRENSARVGVMVVFDTHISKKHVSKMSIEVVGDSVAMFVPHAGRDGVRLLLALEFATWLARQSNVATGSDQPWRTAAACLNDVDTLQRELSMVSEHLSREIARLNEARCTHLSALRTRLHSVLDGT